LLVVPSRAYKWSVSPISNPLHGQYSEADYVGTTYPQRRSRQTASLVLLHSVSGPVVPPGGRSALRPTAREIVSSHPADLSL
jgi:hypothetical protein